MKNKRIPFLIVILIIFSTLFTGCKTLDKLQVKLGFRNNDFEFIKEEKVDKIVIQSTRGTGFRFMVTDPITINEVYEFLSSASPAKTTTNLNSDYVFEMYMGDEVKKYNYVVGINKRGVGNFYDENHSYVVSKRLDNDIIRNLSFIRKPREFEKVYYPSILEVLTKNKDKLNEGNKKIGIDIEGDIDCAQYLLSVDLEDFKRKLQSIIPNASLMNHDRENYDVIVTVKNQGYKTTTFKTIITIEDKKEKSQTNYYVTCEYYGNDWNIKVDTKKPDSW